MHMGVGATVIVLVMAGSASAQECDVFHRCTVGICQNGQCADVPRNNDPCTDSNSCSPNDTCVSGVCHCVGDCDASDHVSMGELMIGIKLAFDPTMIEDCEEFDINHDGLVKANELLAGVNSLIRDCAGPVVRVAVDEPSVFLTGVSQEAMLTAQALDSQGRPIAANITWSSSAPDQVSVDADGFLTANAIGSAMIFAEAADVRSTPTFVVVAEPKAGAMLLTDDQIISVGQPLNVAVDEVSGVGTQYEVVLTGTSTPPAPGTVVLAAGQAPVAGNVVSTRTEADTLVVLVELASLYDLLATYHIDWEIDLKDFPLEVVPAEPNLSAAAGGADESPIRPFEAFDCDGEAKASLVKSEVSLTPEVKLKLVVQDFRDDPALPPGYSMHALIGTHTLTGKVGIRLKANIRAKGTCIAQAKVNIPAAGWISIFFMHAVRIGLGVELSGSAIVAEGEISATGKVGLTETLGWECIGPPNTQCRGLDSIDAITELTFKASAPSLNGMHVQASGHFFALLGLDGVFLGTQHAQIVEARIGPKQSVDLGTEEEQASNEAYASTYDLNLEGTIEPGSALKAAIKKVVDDDAVSVTFRREFELELSKSPRGTLESSEENVRLGESVDFTVRLDSDSLDYAGVGYNVAAVELWRKSGEQDEFEMFDSIPVSSSNQSTFQYRWKPETDALGKYEFAAFVVSNLLVVPLAEITANSVKKVEVSCFGTGSSQLASSGEELWGKQGARPGGAADTCADTWVGTFSDHLDYNPPYIGYDRISHITWVKDPERSTQDRVWYIGHGTWEGHLPEESGCVIFPTRFEIAETGPANPPEYPFIYINHAIVDYTFDPPRFGGEGSEVFGPVTVDCIVGGIVTFPEIQMPWFFGSGELSEDGTTIQGGFTDGGRTTSFLLTRP